MLHFADVWLCHTTMLRFPNERVSMLRLIYKNHTQHLARPVCMGVGKFVKMGGHKV